jgi:hypothetical protein
MERARKLHSVVFFFYIQNYNQENWQENGLRRFKLSKIIPKLPKKGNFYDCPEWGKPKLLRTTNEITEPPNNRRN